MVKRRTRLEFSIPAEQVGKPQHDYILANLQRLFENVSALNDRQVLDWWDEIHGDADE